MKSFSQVLRTRWNSAFLDKDTFLKGLFISGDIGRGRENSLTDSLVARCIAVKGCELRVGIIDAHCVRITYKDYEVALIDTDRKLIIPLRH